MTSPCPAGGVLTDSPAGSTCCPVCSRPVAVLTDFRNRRIAPHAEQDETGA